ncbi:TetR/AcrR family transcriptional regulator [Labedaea rhizosphaerae]|uniref:TetR family transcriptional regulator n=1 Tax=Labedaea rhizosphaerae TaxID=598644 RepID=A0A4R6S2Z4_LABRH|nr:TetR/AcrR family transcriptional regulator [Labedaea rhizosphaerae]TDP93970.1 TetR family transcriptional regulator [Labedaea rhizosphaerae]
MATSTEPARRGRPPSSQKRAAILEAATSVFLDNGYDRTNLDDVAAVAGVSKQTVYRHFTDKKSLFMAVVEAAREQQLRPADAVATVLDPDDLLGSLTRFGERMLTVVLSKRVAALRRVMIGELSRIPELREMWAAGAPTAIATVLITELVALTERGVLDVPDPVAAVENYFGLLSFRGMNNTAYGVTELSAKDRKRIAESAADLFVRAYSR